MDQQKCISVRVNIHNIVLESCKTFYFLALIMLVSCFSSTSVYAQKESVEIGDRVRISAPTFEKGKMKGTVASLSNNVLTLAHNDTTLFIPYELIRKVELSAGKKRNFLKGSLIGIVSGAMVLGGLAAITNDPNCPNCFFEFSNMEAFLFGARFGALIGYPVGGIIGASIKTDRWENVPLNVSAEVAPAYKDFGIEPTVTLRFKF